MTMKYSKIDIITIGGNHKSVSTENSIIASITPSTTFFICMDGIIPDYNQFMGIVGSSDEWIEEAPYKSTKIIA